MLFDNVTKTAQKAITSDEAQKVKKGLGQVFNEMLTNPFTVRVCAATAVGTAIGMMTWLPIDLCATVGALMGFYHAITK